MTEENSSKGKSLRGVLSIGAVAALVHLARAKDVFTDFTRPTVIAALRLLGINAADHGDNISVGRLDVPWTRDCAGLNLLLILLALAIWVNRSERIGWRYFLRVAAMVPAALLANILRVLSLIGYREAFYPDVESPQLHYFLGLVWLVPFVTLVVPRGQRPVHHAVIEMFHAASVVALLAPMAGVPGGDSVTLAAVVGLAHCRMPSQISRKRAAAMMLWIVAATGLGATGMESFWMPWLMLCPLVAEFSWLASPAGILLTVATHPLFGAIPGAQTVTWIAIAYAMWRWIERPEISEAVPSLAVPRWQRVAVFAVSMWFVVPFIASTVMARDKQKLVPPSDVVSRQIPGDGFEVIVPGQPEQIGLVWYGPQGNGRHHTVKVCLKYRGVEITPAPEREGIYTDGTHWFREFFLHEGELITGYVDYLKHTFRPWTSPGVHLIFVAKRESMSAETFDRSCAESASTLHDIIVRTSVKPDTRLASSVGR